MMKGFYKIKESKIEYIGERYFYFDPDRERTLQVCKTSGTSRGKASTPGVYEILNTTFLSNYCSTNTVAKINPNKFYIEFNKIIESLKNRIE